MRSTLLENFRQVFGDTDGVKVYFAPGRVNLIGEHTDYNGGHVFPCALTIGTYAAVRTRNDRKLNFYSMNFKERDVIHSSLDELINIEQDVWANYPKGVLWAFAQHSMSLPFGMDILYYGTIPNSSGLSSSASIEVLTGYLVKELYDFDLDLTKIALLSQYAENKFNQVNCGIMDQFAIAMGKKDHAIYLDTRLLQYEYLPLELKGAKLIIACTNKKRGLGESKYNERRAQCEEALHRLQSVIKISSLGELTLQQFEEYKNIIEDEILTMRARHAVAENQRTIQAVEALKRKDILLFGNLMNDSHRSLQYDYEVTGVELDTLVENAWIQEGVIGSRMTGAGFGGCTVNIVKEESLEQFIFEVGAAYKKRIGYSADFYIVEIGDGPREVNE